MPIKPPRSAGSARMATTALLSGLIGALAFSACGKASGDAFGLGGDDVKSAPHAAGVSSGGGTSASDPKAGSATHRSFRKADGNAPAVQIAVSPLPGTPDASPLTQISFLGPPGTQVDQITATGSRSGTHRGRISSYSTGTGASFLPSARFISGEHVAVTAQVTSSGTTQTVRTSFTVGRQAAFSRTSFPDNPGDPTAIQRYRTLSATPSRVRITTQAKSRAAPGDLFMAPYQGAGTPGAMIAQQNGDLLWFHTLPKGEDATNLQVQEYGGKPVLTWWQGQILQAGFGQGEDVIYNSAYQQIGRVRAGNGYQTDLHEIRLTSNGTAWIDAFDPVDMDLRAYHGVQHGVISDCVVEEIDIKTGLVMWEWHARGHLSPAESRTNPGHNASPWDFIHINSVDPGGSGDVLLSSRNMWAVFDVNIASGAIEWRLGGAHSSFKQGPGTRFYWQHDVEFQPEGLVSMFDNGSSPAKEKQSRGLLLRLDQATHAVALVKQLINPTKTLLASSQGNMLALPGGDWLLGYGGLPNFTEYDAAGHVLLDGTLGKNVQNFRTYLSPWSGQPTSPPTIAAQSAGSGAVNVQASWNGATNVASWQLLSGSAGALAPLATVAKRGFETTIHAAAPGKEIAMRALAANGQALATSSTIPTP
jgi:Arylsulfotransferase (ASST)